MTYTLQNIFLLLLCFYFKFNRFYMHNSRKTDMFPLLKKMCAFVLFLHFYVFISGYLPYSAHN
jgi:1,4-dihydroxy-2-naphthoate octaprenyltransferase